MRLDRNNGISDIWCVLRARCITSLLLQRCTFRVCIRYQHVQAPPDCISALPDDLLNLLSNIRTAGAAAWSCRGRQGEAMQEQQHQCASPAWLAACMAQQQQQEVEEWSQTLSEYLFLVIHLVCCSCNWLRTAERHTSPSMLCFCVPGTFFLCCMILQCSPLTQQ